MGISDTELIQRADLALSDLTTGGGMLTVEQQDTFVRTLQEQSTILRDCRFVPMANPTMEINKIIFGQRFLRAASQDPNASDAVYTGAGRYLVPSARGKVSTSKVTLSSKEIIGEVRIGYELLEDNIEREALRNTILTLVANRAALDLEDLILTGDTSVTPSTPDLAFQKLIDGLFIQSTSNVVDAAGDAFDPTIMANILKTMPKAFRNEPGLGVYGTRNAEIDIRQTFASRNTGLGDAYLTGEAPLVIFGKKFKGADRMPDQKAFYTDPKNIIFGWHRQMQMQMDTDIRSRELIFVWTARIDMKLQEETAFVKIINLAS
jgi:HK97 family phage major capsid protein